MTKEQAKEILWNRCQHTPETAEAIRVLFEEKPQGEWIGNNFDEHVCNRCGHYALYEEEADGQYYEVRSDFCPNCGAKMGGKEE